MMRTLLAVCLSFLVAQTSLQAQPPAGVQDNVDVALEYTLTVDGAVVDSTEGKKPLHYVHGRGQLITGLERQLAGLRVGDEKELTVSAEEGYGAVDPSAVVEVDTAQLPQEITPAIGMRLRGVNPDGRSFQAVVKDIKGSTVVMDLNHPLAGKTLHFKVKVVGLSPAPGS